MTTIKNFVGSNGNLLVLLPNIVQPMTPLEAMQLAARLVIIAEVNSSFEGEKLSFGKILKEVEAEG